MCPPQFAVPKGIDGSTRNLRGGFRKERAIIHTTVDTSWIFARMAHVANGTVVSTAKHDIPYMETSRGIGHLLPPFALCAGLRMLFRLCSSVVVVVAVVWYSGFCFFLFPLRASDPFFCGWQNGRFKAFSSFYRSDSVWSGFFWSRFSRVCYRRGSRRKDESCWTSVDIRVFSNT